MYCTLHYYTNQEVCYQYWPPTMTEGVIIGEYNVKLQNETEYDGYNERTIVVNNNKVNKFIVLYLS